MNPEEITKKMQSYPPINWDTPPAVPRPESWSPEDDAVTDAEIIETVSAHYGWNYADTVARLRSIEYHEAEREA